jgi:hypothetical protein
VSGGLHGVRLALAMVGIAAAALVALKVLVLIAEPWLTFLPVADYPLTPADVGLPFEEVTLTTGDGVRLFGWFIPAGRPRALTLLHFHGNAENIAGCLTLGRLARAAGYNMMLLDYRGYGRSLGRPTERGVYLDGEAAILHLRGRADVDPEKIVPWGRSIGAAVAVHLAASGPVRGVVLESPFTSARDLLREGGHWIFYSLSLLGSYRFDSAARMGRVAAPILVVHGTDDEVAPFVLGRKLHDLATGSRTFLAIEGGGHNDLLARHGEALWDGVRRFLATLEEG